MKFITKLSLLCLGVLSSTLCFASYTWTASYGAYKDHPSDPKYSYSNKVVTDPNGHKIEYIYNQGFGDAQLIQNYTFSDGGWLIGAYDPEGRLLSITDQYSKLQRTYSYADSAHLDWLTSQTDPELGVTTYSYYPNGLRKTEQVNKASSASFSYDKNGAVKTISYSASSDGKIPAAPTLSNIYDANGNLQTVSISNTNKVDNSYDPLNRLITQRITYAAKAYGITYYYDANGALMNVTYPDGFKINYHPNPLGNSTSIQREDANHRDSIVTAIAYSPFNTLTSYSSSSGVKVDHALDTMGRIKTITAGSAVKRSYSYDGENNVLSITNNLDASQNESFSYDGANRLKTAHGPWGSGSYSYDKGNNITQLQVAGQTQHYTYNLKTNLVTELTGSTTDTISYDANGNIIQKGNDHYLYDAANHLIKFSNASHTIQFVYDANGYVILTQEDSKKPVITVHDQSGQLIYKEDPNSNKATDYIYLAGKLAVEATHQIGDINNITYHHIITNPLGSPVASIVGATAEWTQTYRPYGIELKQRPTSEEHIGFTGKETVQDMNLVNMNARYYAPTMGRFMAFDPAPPTVANVFSFNRYAYANDNPLVYIDPTGLTSTGIGGWFHDITHGVGSFGSGLIHEFTGLSLGYDHKHRDAYENGRAAAQNAMAMPFGHGVEMAGMGIGMAIKGVGGLIETAETASMIEKNVAGQVNAARGSTEVSAYSYGSKVGLQKQLTSQDQIAQISRGSFTKIAGAGTTKELRDASRLANEYGGLPENWTKIRSYNKTQLDGFNQETHAYQNIADGRIVEYKSKLEGH